LNFLIQKFSEFEQESKTRIEQSVSLLFISAPFFSTKFNQSENRLKMAQLVNDYV